MEPAFWVAAVAALSLSASFLPKEPGVSVPFEPTGTAVFENQKIRAKFRSYNTCFMNCQSCSRTYKKANSDL